MDSYEEFIALVKKIQLLEYVDHLLDWDRQVLLTEGGNAARAAQSGVIASLRHDLFTSERLGELLKQLENESLNEDQAANVREVRREYDRATRVPGELVERFAQKTGEAYSIWVEAREKKDFSLFAPVLKELVALRREYAQIIDPKKPPYENLLHDFEPWFTPAEINSFFAQIKETLVPLIKAINDEQKTDFLREDVDHEVQLAFNKEIAGALGFDYTKGRLDLSVHPFTCHPGDVRITTRFSDGWWKAISSTLHETGHGLYEQNLPNEFFATPRGMDAWMAVHESQSRMWENQIGLSKNFWEPRFEDMKERYGLSCSLDEFIKAINCVKPGFIRVNADELTYPLHIILRYEIEQALIGGEIEVDDLPRVWNEKMEEYLGITPPDDSLGVLQDVHWSTGCFGYFPTYLLGNMLSSQFFAAANTEDLGELLSWLRVHVHEKGRLLSTQDLVKQATGNEPRPDEYLDYLKNKYSELYGLNNG